MKLIKRAIPFVMLLVLLIGVLVPTQAIDIYGSQYYQNGDWSYEINDNIAFIRGYLGEGGDVVIPSELRGCKVTGIYLSAFEDESAITSLVIPETVTTIMEYAFKGCSGLTSVTIPNSVTKIWEGAFSGCVALERVEISDLFAWCKISFKDYESNPLYYANHLYLNGI